MHGPTPPHNPLAQAAKEMSAVARETKSPLFERVATVTLITSALATTALAGMQAWHMLRRDLEKDRERQRERDNDRRWSARQDEPEATYAEAARRDRHAHATQR